jgi:hypothetical protein
MYLQHKVLGSRLHQLRIAPEHPKSRRKTVKSCKRSSCNRLGLPTPRISRGTRDRLNAASYPAVASGYSFALANGLASSHRFRTDARSSSPSVRSVASAAAGYGRFAHVADTHISPSALPLSSRPVNSSVPGPARECSFGPPAGAHLSA